MRTKYNLGTDDDGSTATPCYLLQLLGMRMPVNEDKVLTQAKMTTEVQQFLVAAITRYGDASK